MVILFIYFFVIISNIYFFLMSLPRILIYLSFYPFIFWIFLFTVISFAWTIFFIFDLFRFELVNDRTTFSFASKGHNPYCKNEMRFWFTNRKICSQGLVLTVLFYQHKILTLFFTYAEYKLIHLNSILTPNYTVIWKTLIWSWHVLIDRKRCCLDIALKILFLSWFFSHGKIKTNKMKQELNVRSRPNVSY